MGQPRSVTIGLVFDYNLDYPRRVLRGIKQFAQARPHWVLAHLDAERVTASMLESVRPAGVIAVVRNYTTARLLESLRRRVVNVASALHDLPFACVRVDHRQVGALAGSHLRDRGFRHFGFVGHPHHFYSSEREAGFRQSLASNHSLACFHEHPATSFRYRGHLLFLKANFQRWLRGLPKPVGVFACHDIFALQVVEACRLLGLRVPDDVAVVGVDNDDLLCEMARPSLSSIILPAERVGFEASALLERMMEKNRCPRKPRLIPPCGVVTRQSSDVLAGGDPDVTAAMRFIYEHRHAPISVTEVLRQVPASRRSLERRFRLLLERGIGDEIRRLHLERAKDLLGTTTLSISEVAEQSGFRSVYYLSRVFRRKMGMTPMAYRRRAGTMGRSG